MKTIINILVLGCILHSCETIPETSTSATKLEKYAEPKLVSEWGNNASGPYFTIDHKGRKVLVWTEEVSEGKKVENLMKFARINEDGNLSKSKEVVTSRGCRAHDESMNKLAFKKDGTIVAVFSKRSPSTKNRFAGELYYTQSFDDGEK